MVREMRECFDILLPVVPGTDAIALAGNAINIPNTSGAASAPSSSVHAAPLGEEAAEDSTLKQGMEDRVWQAKVAGGEEDSDDAEGMEWEEGGNQGNDNSDAGSDQEEETGERTVSAKLRRVDGIGGTLRTVADTVEAAGLGTSGYELQIEVRQAEEWCHFIAIHERFDVLRVSFEACFDRPVEVCQSSMSKFQGHIVVVVAYLGSSDIICFGGFQRT